MRISTALVVTLVLAGLSPLSSPAGPAEAATVTHVGVCAGVDGCHVRSHVDIDGDGQRDAVGMAHRGRSSDQVVIVRVKTGPRQIDTARYHMSFWHGSPWQGTAALDGRPGREIVVGRTMGAHAQLYRALTWRHDGLTQLDAPGSGGSFMIDAAVWISLGWKRPAAAPAGVIRMRHAERIGDYRSPFHGVVSTYRWNQGSWDRTRVNDRGRISDRCARRWGGFRVEGLDRW
jgi:hypothetical protein